MLPAFRNARMTSIVSAGSSADYYSSVFAAGSSPDWIGETIVAIQNSANLGGILGALANSGDGSIDSILGQNSINAGNFALISQNSVTNASAFYAQIASQNQQQRSQELLQKAFQDLSESQNRVKAENVLDPFIYLLDGTTIDTENNIMTRPDGTQYDTTTGAKYVDPSFIIQMANGAYLDTKNNILTLADDTQIDTVTGLTVSQDA
jgi:hypothetical protein